MARPRSEQQGTTPEAEAATAQALAEREGEAQAVEEQAATEAEAAEKRAKAQASALELKSVPDGAQPPTEKEVGGTTQFSRQFLLDNSTDLLGHPSHVVAGALYGDSREYMSVEDAQTTIDAWLAAPVAVQDES